MYFKNRCEAGLLLAEELIRTYSMTQSVLLCITDGGILVAEPIADKLGIPAVMLIIKEIALPGERQNIGSIDQVGSFTLNPTLSNGQVEEYMEDYRNFVEAEKLRNIRDINEIIKGKISGTADKKYLKDKNVIIVADGLSENSLLEATMEFLKPVRAKRIIAAIPMVSVSVIDRLHILTDEIHVLDVKQNYLETDHYYESNQIPSKDQLLSRLDKYHRRLTS